MYQSMQRRGTFAFLKEEAPSLLVAFAIADLFFKWGSFALECVGFLATWFVLSFLHGRLAAWLRRDAPAPQRPRT